MIQITNSTEKEIEPFEDKTWRNEDIEHYGEPVQWIVKKFIFKATERGKIIGIVKGKFETGVIYIDTVIVAKEKRCIGVGKKLMDKVESFARQNNTHKIFLFTMEKWKASKFYKSLGFKKSGELPKHYLKRDFVIYSKYI